MSQSRAIVYMSDLDVHPVTSASIERLKQLYGFTRREVETVLQLTKGKTTSEISKLLNIAENTVITHIKRAMDKSNTRKRCELVSLLLTDFSLRLGEIRSR